MSQARSSSRFVIVSLVCLLLIPTLAFAKNAANEPVGKLSATASAAQWSIAGDHEMVTLTVVAPDGTTFRKDFAAGTSPSVALHDFGGKLLDGTYHYELRVTPRISAAVRSQLAAARAGNADDATVMKIQKNAGIYEPIVQSGSLMVFNGAFVSSDVEEAPAVKDPNTGTVSASSISNPKVKPADVVTADDAIIQGSICVGLDCVNNESFGFDTVRLKENNTRIKFDDTSSSTGFPANDWQLTANDSASGGSNKFSIEDITGSKVPFTVTAGAATNSIFVDSTGRVGFRTSTPVLDLHVATSNTPALRLEQNNSGGFTAQTWDVAGNEANFFVRDVTGGSRLPFRIRPGAPTSSIDISASGNVGIGTASASTSLDVSGTGARFTGTLGSETHSDANVYAGVFNTTPRIIFGGTTTQQIDNLSGALRFFRPGAISMVIDSNGLVGINCTAPTAQLVIASGSGCSTPSSSINPGASQFTVASSRTFKENIEKVDVPDILTKIQAVPVVTYDFKNNGPKDRLGLIAEDFHQVFERGSEKYIDGQEVQMALWMAVQKLTAENKALTDRLAKLEAAQQKGQN
ncbi:MAG: hypothetical protein QOE82_826 [Thermoanaerobaculia bacterium]|jgi:hypothetical protein|nr:hypothetical protein [Thermoanaerobaculia bacterium]